MELKANCKINLGLRVLGRRADGFHNIETVMYPVRGLYDTVRAEASSSGNRLIETGIQSGCPPEKNICMRALELLQSRYDIGGATVTLHKTVPTGAGLGGGSSDAVATLRALDGEFALGLSDDTLAELGAELGSDVPFFVRNTPQLATGRGEILTPINIDLAGLWLAIVKPPVAVSTAEAYAGVTPHTEGMPLAEVLRHDISEWKELLINDFEVSVFARHPVLAQLKRQLYDSGAIYAAMSGSGSALFGIFAHRPTLAPDLAPTLFLHTEEIRAYLDFSTEAIF
ncbi:MAG: 4-(cytidine 5'-diphospho)-2-C-methyl-D-erythritol kinase [Rikenellaceae bacterium]|jgi:4-diphosphocytidyl-2-C-methyl-D-erythritol kinase|nr:4-(cytidine 5'-diphospho)-2-C-methyl-D-erythritol kinase [Rikenellaceae bacterium]